MGGPVPERFRAALSEVIQRVVAGDFTGIQQGGLASAGNDIGTWVRSYSRRLVDLPDEAWALSEAGEIAARPGCWWVVVPLWDASGRSDLSLEATVEETPQGLINVAIDNIHVL